MRLSVFEIFLIELILYALLWMWDQYVASYACLIFPIVIAVILLISWIADLIDPARIGHKYYLIMILSVIAPIAVSAFFYFVYGGELAWMKK